ncbi:MAG: glycosyltransferase family 2 protein [Candidatus Diapherotrites archaeon]|nr:glycosyltransferase family 2 protein [Candidatus Diapherotrites archaeon]
MKLAITIPAFNEEKTIAKVIGEIPRRIEGIKEIEIIVIDDGSTDNTGKIAEKCGAAVVRHSGNRGLAKAFRTGLDAALESGAGIIVNTDADFQYNQKQIPLLVKPILDGNAEIVLGSRFKGWIEEMPFSKKFGNILATKIVNFVSGLRVSDAQTGFRAFSREAALRMNISSDFTYTQESLLIAQEYKLKIAEVPVDFRKREGKSRLFGSIWGYAKRAGITLLIAYLNYHPLKFFLSLGGLFVLGGLAAGTRVLLHFLETGMVQPYLPTALLASLLLILGFEVIIIGLVAEMVKFSRKAQDEILYFIKK